MGHVDPKTIAAVAAALRSGNATAQRSTLETTPILPPNGVPALSKMKEKDATGTWQQMQKSDDGPYVPGADWTKLKYEQAADMLGFIELQIPRIEEFVGSITFDVKHAAEFANAAAIGNRIPIWWLPWLSRHITKLKIPALAASPTIDLGGAKGSIPSPPLFFTAAINGCSVFAVGDDTSPSLYHAGITGELRKEMGNAEFTRLGGTSEAVWRSLLGRAGPRNDIGETNRSRYVAERTSATAGETDRYLGGKELEKYTTLEALKAEAYLQRRQEITGVSVVPWGAVFGLRDGGGHWSFTLVRNATVTYYHLVRKGASAFSVGTPTAVGEKRLSTMYMNPDGSAKTADLKGMDKASLKKQYAENVYSVAINLGHEQFFPGGQAAVYRDYNTFQIV